MNRFVEFPFDEGGSILVEVSVSEEEGRLIKAASPEDLTIKAAISFENALSSVRPIANAVFSKLQGLSCPPDEIRVEFGLTFKAEGNAILTRVGGDANLKVNLNWKREK